MKLILKLLLSLSIASTLSADTTRKKEGFFTPDGDNKGMKAMPETLDPTLPNVLILGDSISIAYTNGTRNGLTGKANVIRPKDNCGDTSAGLKNLERWLGDTKWDVIHFNWGLHDLCYRNPEVKTQGNRDKINGKQSVPPEDYEKNLGQLVTKLKATGATLIWASTTIIPEGEIGRFVGDDIKYNAIAAKIMDRHGIQINDLHTVSKQFQGKHSTGTGDVHFIRSGSAKLAQTVVTAIETALQKRNSPPNLNHP